jgi:Leucine-rich repeat (LRR) protein
LVSGQSILETAFNEVNQREKELITLDSAYRTNRTLVKRIRVQNDEDCKKLIGQIGTFKNLVEVDGSFSGLKAFPDFLKEASQIQVLTLNHNSITSIPDWIPALKSLVELDVSYNSLSQLDKGLFKLDHLEELNLRENHIEVLGQEIKNLSQLTKLDLYSNNLTSIPNEIRALKKLKIFFLTKNKLSRDELEKVRQLLPNSATGISNRPKQKE